MRVYSSICLLFVLVACSDPPYTGGTGGESSSSSAASSSSSGGKDPYACSTPGEVCGDNPDGTYNACNRKGQCVRHEIPVGCWEGKGGDVCPTCDDGNPCTLDVCDDGACRHSAAKGMQGNTCDTLGFMYCANRSCCPMVIPPQCVLDADCGVPGNVCLASTCFVGCEKDPEHGCDYVKPPGSTCKVASAGGLTRSVCAWE